METTRRPLTLAANRAALVARLMANPAVLGFWGALAAGAAVRLWRLETKSLWFDEAYSVFVANQPLVDIPRLLRLYDTHPPLHYVLLHFWMPLVGSSEMAVRGLSVAASVGVIALTYLFARRLAEGRVAALAALIVAFSPFQIIAAQEARMYPFLTLFSLGASYALWLALEGGRRRYWIVYAALLFLALTTHHFAFLLVLAHGIYIVAAHRRRGGTVAWARWTGLAVVAYAPLLPLLWGQLTTARAWPDIRPPFGLGALTDTLGMLSFGGGMLGMGTYFRAGSLGLEYRPAILLPFLLLSACGVGALIDTRRRTFVLVYWLVPVLATAAVSVRWNIFYERYFSFVLPAVSVLLAAGIFFLSDTVRPGLRRGVLAGLLTYLISFNAPTLAAVYSTRPTYDWRAAGWHVGAAARGDDFVLFVPAYTRIPFEYYFHGSQARMAINPQEVLAVHLQAQRGSLRLRTSVEPAQMSAIARKHPRMWMIASLGLGGEVRAQMAQGLAPYFRQVGEDAFGLVGASLWESRLYQREGGR
ncbi:MAG: glycosyltransferase family 39 protein [bacterium]